MPVYVFKLKKNKFNIYASDDKKALDKLTDELYENLELEVHQTYDERIKEIQEKENEKENQER